MIIPYKVLATEAILTIIFPSYLTDISAPTFSAPYKHIYRQDGKYETKQSNDGTTTITWKIGTLVAFKTKWTIAFNAKFKPLIPMILITDRKEPSSMLIYKNEDMKIHREIIFPKQIELSGYLPRHLEYILSDRANSAIFGILGILLILIWALLYLLDIAGTIVLAFLIGIFLITAIYVWLKGGVPK